MCLVQKKPVGWLTLLLTSFVGPGVLASEPFRVHPVSTSLIVHRVDYAAKSTPVIERIFKRFESERGVFGPGWCSNLDLFLRGPAEIESTKKDLPASVELRDCFRAESKEQNQRVFKRTHDAWVEARTGARILLKSDGRWQLTEAPHAIFRPDGRLESFQAVDGVRWFLRRDAKSQIDSVDSLKSKAAKFHRDSEGDIVSLSENGGPPLATYRHNVFLMAVKKANVTESYEYDGDDNIIKIALRDSSRSEKAWGISYRSVERVASIHHPGGCVSQWAFEKPIGETSGLAVASSRAKEVRNCPMSAKGPTTISSSRDVASLHTQRVLIQKLGPLGVGVEKAQVTLNADAMPVLFEIVSPSAKGEQPSVVRLEIEREPKSGSVVKIRGRNTFINFVQKPRNYEKNQLDLLDDYEAWMAAWGSHAGN